MSFIQRIEISVEHFVVCEMFKTDQCIELITTIIVFTRVLEESLEMKRDYTKNIRMQ